MARRTNSGPGSEFDGTGPDDSGIDGAADPASLGGGSGGNNSGGNSGSGDSDGFDPAIHAGRDKRNSDGSFARKRGRKAGTGSGSARRSNTADLKGSIEALAKTLIVVHAGVAAATHTEELVIDKEEAELLANATANVLDQFDLKPDPRTQAIVGFVMTAGVVYGPRIALIRARKAAEAQERKANANGAGVASVINPGGEFSTTDFRHSN